MRLDVHLEGHGIAGTLSRDDQLAVSFRYADDYAGPALSLGLPVAGKAFGDLPSRAYFHNLLQEGERLDRVAAQYQLERTDTVGLLSHLGRDCAGAISVVPEGAPPGKMPGDLTADYAEIGEEQLARDVAALYAKRPPRKRAEFSLAGVQSKMAVTVHPDGRVLEPLEGAPTTHILKVGNAEDEVLVENELVVMKTARRLGLPVADCAMGRAGGIPYLMVPRFDRAVDGSLVRRLHQEDCCQALGLPPSMKYEKYADPTDERRAASFANLFGLSLHTADPVGFEDALVRITFFNYLVGNADAHAKNFALLHAGRRPTLAPFFDLVCIALYSSAAQDFAMRIGGTADWDGVDRNSWLNFLETAGRRGRSADRTIDKHLRPMAGAILGTMDDVIAAEGLDGSRVRLVRDCVGDRIRHLNATLGFGIPVATDAFAVRGGGWLLSS